METQEHTVTDSTLIKNQKIKTGWKIIENGKLRIKVEIRYDDECGNGHNTFSIGGTIEEKRGNNRWYDYMGGCIHEEIEKYYPEYKHLIKWHLCSSNGPMYYLENTVYHASDRDCYGKKKEEPSNYSYALKFDCFPITFKIAARFSSYLKGLGKSDLKRLVIEEISHEDREGYKFASKYTFQGFTGVWHECPFNTLKEAEEMREALSTHPFKIIQIPTAFSEGKTPDLDAARSCAIWPEATDEELLSPNLKEKLIERLPRLLTDFRADIEKLGFVY